MSFAPQFVQGESGPVEVRKIRHGEIVTEDGLYDMPIGWYHDACTDGPCMSSSGLRTLWKKTPAHYWDVSPFNPNRRPDPEVEGEALRIGRAAHTLLLEPHLFKEQFKTRPPQWDSWRTAAAKAWRAEMTIEGFTVMEGEEMLRVSGIAASLRRHPLYEQGILDGDLELSLIWRDPRTKLWLKSRPDAIPTGSNILADLKCLRAGDTDSLSRSIYDAGYDIQMALAAVGMRHLLGRAMEDFVLVVVENDRPHAVRIAPIPHDEVERAVLMLRAAINLAAECFRTEHWPAYEADDAIPVYRRPYALKTIEEAIERGTIPRSF
jgi:hypothetical protein